MKRFKVKDCDGHVMVVVGIALILLIILAGIAIDSGRAYSVKAKLNAAVDAAGLAAARSIADGQDQAKAAALTFFNANYPSNYIHSPPSFCPPSGNPTISSDPNTGDSTVTVWATADMPTVFMRVVGQNTVSVAANAAVTRRAVDLSFIVDNTGSIGSNGEDLIDRSIEFVDHFHPNFDRMALIKYAFGAELAVPIRTVNRGFPKATIDAEIAAFNFSGGTNCAEGFWLGKKQLDSVTNPSSLRVIVFFTDGVTNTFASTFLKAGETTFTYDKLHSGSVATQETAQYAAGFWRHFKVKDPDPSPWYQQNPSNGYYVLDIENEIKQLPQYYNPCIANALDSFGNCIDPHTDNYGSPPVAGDCGCSNDPNLDPNTDPSDPDVFSVLNPSHPLRPVTQLTPGFTRTELYTKINRAARNLLEEMAKKARQQGIFVYTLGLGPQLQDPMGPAMENGEQEVGEDLLRNMANDPHADTYDPNEPEGIYCHAVDADALGPCFNEIVEAIIRLTI